ncbi:glycosyltransferase [Candidatus Poribacteria bacterium]|nr:glycosyltransferase [Candidatus Poribacteria bacterium]
MKPRIAILTNYPLNNKDFVGGVGTASVGLVSSLMAYTGEFNFHVITLSRKADRDINCKHNGINFHYLTVKRLLRPRFTFFLLNVLKNLHHIKPDLIHCQDNTILATATLLSKIKSVFTVHGVKQAEARVWGRLKGKPGVFLDAEAQKYIFSRFRNIIAISPYVANFMPEGKRVFNIPNPVSDIFFQPEPDNPPTPGKYVVYAGALTPLKRPEDILLSAEILQRKESDLQFIFCGSGDRAYINKLKKQTKELNLKDIHFTGHITQEKLKSYIQHAKALILPSTQENSPMVIAEAMVLGTPVIATNVGGIPYMIENMRTGILYQPGDITGLAKHIRELLSNTDLWSDISKKAQLEARNKYSPENVADMTVNVYRKLLN